MAVRCIAMLAAVLAVGCVVVAAGIAAGARTVAASPVAAADMAAAVADTAAAEHHAAHRPAVDWPAMAAETHVASHITAMLSFRGKTLVSRHGTAMRTVLMRPLIGDVA